MKLTKAIINCERCYTLAETYISIITKGKGTKESDFIKEPFRKQVYNEHREKHNYTSESNVQKELIKLPEYRKKICTLNNDIYNVRNIVLDSLAKTSKSIQAQSYCLKCDYSSPKVAKYLKSEG